MKRPQRVEIHVDHLVLDGLPPQRRQAVVAAVERELARLVAERGPAAARSATELGAAVARATRLGSLHVGEGLAPSREGASPSPTSKATPVRATAEGNKP